MTNILEWLVAALIWLLAVTGTSSEVPPMPSPEVVTPPAISINVNPAPPTRPEAIAESTLENFLSLVPWNKDYRSLVMFGDMLGWYEGTGIARQDSLAEAQTLPDTQREAWLFGMYGQTTPPAVLGVNYLASADMREYYGFSFFDALQSVEAGSPPNGITIVRVDASAAMIHVTLAGMGYTVEDISGATLYSLHDDYEMDTAGSNVFGRLAQLNRIAILDTADASAITLLIGRATSVIENALGAGAGDVPALLDDPFVAAVAHEIDANSFDAPGALVGTIMMGGPIPADPMAALGERGEAITDALRRYGDAPLDQWIQAGFTTHRDGDAVYLTVLLALTPGADARMNAERLAERMQEYPGLAAQMPEDEAWLLHAHGAGGSAEIPIAWVTMRVNDARVNRDNWMRAISMRDQLYLTPGVPLLQD